MSRFMATVVVGGVLAMATQAQAATVKLPNATPAASAQSFASRYQSPEVLRPAVDDRQIQQIINRVRSDADSLRRTMDATRPRPDDEAFYLIDDVVQASDHLADHLARRQVIRADVDDLLRRGAQLEDAIDRRAPSRQVQNSWTTLQRDLDSVASAYGVN